MTDIQIKWHQMLTDRARLAEDKRHNLAYEGETNRHNLATEDLGYRTLGETNRHNVVMESQGWKGLEYEGQKLEESIRHNKASEEASMLSASAAMKQALTAEYLSQFTAAEKTASTQLTYANLKRTEIENEVANRTVEARVGSAYYDQAIKAAEERKMESEAEYSEKYNKYKARNEGLDPWIRGLTSIVGAASKIIS